MSLGPIVPVAQGVAEGAIKVLSSDLVRIQHRFYRRIRIKVATGKLTKSGRPSYRTEYRYEPLDVEAKANPLGIGILGVLGALGAAVLFGRVQVGVPTIGQIELYKGPLADEFEEFKANWKLRKQRELEAELNEARSTPPNERVNEFTCDELKQKAGRAYSQGHISEGDYWRDVARAQGCAWATGLQT